ncbi:MAG: ABC transporter permease subunit [Acidobacteriaceae bacterium]|nr:ABC transporter permease subunit [Acidobacteriaceae bacterium]
MKHIWTMAGVTFHEAARKQILWMALLAGAAFLLLFGIALHFQIEAFHDGHVRPFIQKQVLSGMLMMGLYAIDLLVVVMTVLTSVDTLSGEIASGTIQAMATKPVRRWELLTGKWLGFSAMLTLYITMMVFGINGLTYLMTGVTARHLPQGLGLIWLESMLLLSVCFFFGTSFSTLTNGVLVLGLHGLAFLGGWIEQAGALTNTPKAVAVGVVASMMMPSESLWRRAAFEMQSPLATAVNMSPFSGASVPSPMMIGYAALYMAVFFVLAIRRLSNRDL